MTKIKISASDYDYKKTFWKTVREFCIWVLPQLATFLIGQFPEFAEMSVAALVSIGLKTLQDYIKHK